MSRTYRRRGQRHEYRWVLREILDLDGKDTGRRLVLERVVAIHIDERCLKNGRLDALAMQPIARCGYDEYTVIDRVFSMERPAGGGRSTPP